MEKKKLESQRKVLRQDEINWKKLKHVEIKLGEDNQSLILKLKPTSVPLPKVTIISEITDPILFQFCVYSWRSLAYPAKLLNWVIVDNSKLFENKNEMVDLSLLEDKRVRIIQFQGKFNSMVEKVMNMSWIDSEDSTECKEVVTVSGIDNAIFSANEEEPQPEPEPEPEPEVVERYQVYTTMACGDILYPDTLSAKHRAMTSLKVDCVTPSILAYYNPVGNVSFVLKLFPEYPESGLYWKKKWWNSKSSNHCAGIPYIGNCITIGLPSMKGAIQLSSIKFFSIFPDPIKKLVTNILQAMVSSNNSYDDSSDESSDDPTDLNKLEKSADSKDKT